jgi:hypothetical protein
MPFSDTIHSCVILVLFEQKKKKKSNKFERNDNVIDIYALQTVTVTLLIFFP